MSETKRCPQCQAEIPAAAPEGLCPQCLLKAGLESKAAEEPKTAAYSPSGSRFEPPTPAELQASFPQLEILELLGKGGMGAVYKARQPGLDRLVAVKILPPEVSRDPAFAERFTREARALAMLNHPNIVGVYDSGRAHPSPPTPLPEGERGGPYYFVMEFVDGVNLRQAMRTGQLKAAEALKIVPQICDALQFAHDEGIVHRDIKPENILLDKKGRVKIADFGLAKLLGKTAVDVSLTGTQQAMGTMHYMAPEQFEGARDVDHRADIYSLGVTFYEMLTGELPIGRFAAPSKKVQIDVRLDEVVLRSLEKAPELRYQHASEIKTDVETIAQEPAESMTDQAEAASTIEPRVPRRPRLFQILGVMAATGGILSIFGTASELLVPAEIPPGFAGNESLLSAYHIYAISSKVVQYLLGVAIVPCGIGLVLRMPWARRATIWITLFEMALLVAVHAPADYAMEFQSLPADGIVPQPDGKQLLVGREQLVRELTFRYMWQTTGLLILNLLVVYYLTRPHVLKLFGEERKSAAPYPVVPPMRADDAGAAKPVRSGSLEPEQRYQQASEIKTKVEAINLTPSSGRKVPPSTEAELSNTAELSPINLLEATSGWKRWLPVVSLVAGVIGAFTLIALSPNDGRDVCAGLSIFIGFMLLSMILSLLLTLRWTVEYRGHQIVVEFRYGSASRRLMIDGLTAASATGATPSAVGKGWGYELRATIPHGQGIGDEIVWTVDRSMVLRCRIIALPKTPITPAMEGKEPEQRYQQAGEIKTDLDAMKAERPQEPAGSSGAQAKLPWGVPVVGVLNVVAAVVLMTIVTASILNPDPPPADDGLRPFFDVWVVGEPIVEYVSAVLWLAAGIGLMLWQSWARRVTVTVALFQLVYYVVWIPALVVFSVQPAIEQAAEVAGPDENSQALYVLFVIVAFGAAIVMSLVYLIGVFIYLTRPRIVAACGPRNE